MFSVNVPSAGWSPDGGFTSISMSSAFASLGRSENDGTAFDALLGRWSGVGAFASTFEPPKPVTQHRPPPFRKYPYTAWDKYAPFRCGLRLPPLSATPNFSTYCDQLVTMMGSFTGPPGAKP